MLPLGIPPPAACRFRYISLSSFGSFCKPPFGSRTFGETKLVAVVPRGRFSSLRYPCMAADTSSAETSSRSCEEYKDCIWTDEFQEQRRQQLVDTSRRKQSARPIDIDGVNLPPAPPLSILVWISAWSTPRPFPFLSILSCVVLILAVQQQFYLQSIFPRRPSVIVELQSVPC